jgi:hypothetical protein
MKASNLSRRVGAAVSAARRLPHTPLQTCRAKSSTLFSILLFSILLGVQEASACPFCYGAKDGKGTQHMAVAIWFLFGAVMTVLGGIGAFSFHIWRHGRMPAEPYQELSDEDLSRYE